MISHQALFSVLTLPTKAIVAVSHTVAVNFYHMITKRVAYQELGANSFDALDRERLTKHTVKRFEAQAMK